MIDRIRQHMPDAIRRRRAELRLSLDEVGARAGASKSHIWAMESGRNPNPTIAMALALCDALSMSLNDLLGVDASQPRFTEQEMALIAAHREIFARSALGEGV